MRVIQARTVVSHPVAYGCMSATAGATIELDSAQITCPREKDRAGAKATAPSPLPRVFASAGPDQTISRARGGQWLVIDRSVWRGVLMDSLPGEEGLLDGERLILAQS